MIGYDLNIYKSYINQGRPKAAARFFARLAFNQQHDGQ